MIRNGQLISAHRGFKIICRMIEHDMKILIGFIEQKYQFMLLLALHFLISSLLLCLCESDQIFPKAKIYYTLI